MRISVNWLKDFVAIDLSPTHLLQTLNSIGMMVDSWEERDGDLFLEIGTYANRPDTLGHLGIARELAAALDLPLKEQDWPLTELQEASSEIVDIQIYDDDLCPRYCGIVVKGIKVSPSPDWLRKRIEAMGLSPVNNVVDASNYVLFATAHPTHAFDLAKLSGSKIIVRKAKKGEVFRSLEGEDVSLTPDMLVIADEKSPVALAGVIGGMSSAVSETTRDILIESAYFNPISIRKTSKKTGIQTDASYRFERGADIDFLPRAALMVASLLTQMGGKAARGVVDVFPKPRKNKTVILRHQRIADLLGIDVDEDFVSKILTRLEFRVETQQQGIWKVRIPFFRVDVEQEADLIEEIARYFGYDKIPSTIPPLVEFEPPPDPRKRQVQKLRHTLFGYGFDEVVNFSFIDPVRETAFHTGLTPIEIRNPISARASHLRTTLLGSLLENINWNRNRGMEGIHLFEVGNVYFWDEHSCKEKLRLALATTGFLGKDSWNEQRKPTGFFHLKGACEAVLTHLRYIPVVYKPDDCPPFEEGSVLSVHVKGEKIGQMGRIRKAILADFSLKEPVWAAEWDLSVLFRKQPQLFQYEPVAKYPYVVRDISFLAEQNVSYQEIKQTIEELSLPHLEQFELCDRYSGSVLSKGKVSLSFRFLFRHPQRTLLAREVESSQEKVIKALSKKFNFRLREGGEIDK